MDNEKIPPSKKSLTDALVLSEEILADIELNRMPLTNIALKIGRLSRLLNDFDHQKIMEYESGGYPTNPKGFPKEVWRLAKIAGRTFISSSPRHLNI